MRARDVILFCSMSERAKRILERLTAAGVTHAHVTSGTGEQHSLDLSTLTVDLVICESEKEPFNRFHLSTLCSASNTRDNIEKHLSRDVTHAISTQQIVPYYQPKVCIKTGNILGVEVLARWQHPEKGLLFPAQFLDVVEKGNAYGLLFFSLLMQGLKLHKYLYSMGESLAFSYNIESSQLLVENFASQLIKQVREAGLPLRFITLEITEKQMLAFDMVVIENIKILVKSGVNLSLDDFGTGFSSISRLAKLPFNQIKLDAEFVAQSLGFKESRIIESIVALSCALNLEVVAEGVETESQRKHLEQLGVDSVQGYLFYKAMDGTALIKVLQA